ncbi:hypothetical protein DWV52_08380 [Ruminococcaceae bacterium AF10-16]|nr:hypothetical protein DWV52_08380 [Ruminococcaceae bacterium AF10-16]
MNARDFYPAFVRTARESTLVTKEMLPSFPEAWGTATFLDLYRNNEPAYTELVNKYIVHKIIEDAGMTAQHEYFRIDTVGWITRYQEMAEEAHKLDLSAHLWDLEIAVEHENSKQDWTDEVIKLIHVKCPLKVVISYSHCDERDTTEWKKLKFIARWMQEVKAFAKGSDEEYLLIFGNCFNSKTRLTTILSIIVDICTTARHGASIGYRQQKRIQTQRGMILRQNHLVPYYIL